MEIIVNWILKKIQVSLAALREYEVILIKKIYLNKNRSGISLAYPEDS